MFCRCDWSKNEKWKSLDFRNCLFCHLSCSMNVLICKISCIGRFSPLEISDRIHFSFFVFEIYCRQHCYDHNVVICLTFLITLSAYVSFIFYTDSILNLFYRMFSFYHIYLYSIISEEIKYCKSVYWGLRFYVELSCWKWIIIPLSYRTRCNILWCSLSTGNLLQCYVLKEFARRNERGFNICCV